MGFQCFLGFAVLLDSGPVGPRHLPRSADSPVWRHPIGVDVGAMGPWVKAVGPSEQSKVIRFSSAGPNLGQREFGRVVYTRFLNRFFQEDGFTSMASTKRIWVHGSRTWIHVQRKFYAVDYGCEPVLRTPRNSQISLRISSLSLSGLALARSHGKTKR